MPPTTADLADIQGNILRAYGMHFARYTFVRFRDAAGVKKLLGLVAGEVTSATTWDGIKPPWALNVAISYSGLRFLGLPDVELASFPDEFRAGMAARAALLGDTGKSAPATWKVGGAAVPVDALLTLSAQTPEALDVARQTLLKLLAGFPTALEIAYVLDTAALESGTEHFGFLDGFSQPEIEGSGAPHYPGDGTPVAGGGWSPVRTGEFVLGYVDESGHPPPMPSPDALGRNGSFMVFRQLQQEVPAFRDYLTTIATRFFNGNKDLFAAKMIGRWKSGCPLELSPTQDNPALATNYSKNNDFRYGTDPGGLRCPVGAHVRRANPRDDLDTGSEALVRRHRIVRRGLPYGTWLPEGTTDNEERGIAFIAINSSISRQFEFIQKDWINSGDFSIARLADNDRDPMARSNESPSNFKVPVDSAPPVRLFNLPDFVIVRGGEYFFIPSLTAIRYLAILP